MPLFSAISKFELARRANMQPIETFLFIENKDHVFLFFHR